MPYFGAVDWLDEELWELWVCGRDGLCFAERAYVGFFLFENWEWERGCSCGLLTGGDFRKVGLELSTASPKNGLASSSTASAAFNPDFNTFTKKLRSQSCNWEFNLFFYFGFHRKQFFRTVA
jgi:hypothetical protein